jgi:hypothetical protein
MHGEGDPAAAWLGDRQPAERLIWRSQSTSRGSRPTRRRVPPRHVAEVPLHNGVGASIDFPECVLSAHPNRVAATETVAAPNGRPPRASRRTTSASAPGLALGEAAVNGPIAAHPAGLGGRAPASRLGGDRPLPGDRCYRRSSAAGSEGELTWGKHLTRACCSFGREAALAVADRYAVLARLDGTGHLRLRRPRRSCVDLP